MNPVVHFEIPAVDKNRMSDFYSKVFGWKTQIMGPEFGDYVVVQTTESDEKTRRPLTPGAINGGFFPRTEGHSTPTVVISVDDIQEAMKKVEEAGGKIAGGEKLGVPDDIPGIGLYIAVVDTEGNKVALLQPSPQM
ncbi:MAG TPA: VOC family protein [Xanthomonadales bacterium]|nr:VOC family protein [Xanthomonadales bacterium]